MLAIDEQLQAEVDVTALRILYRRDSDSQVDRNLDTLVERILYRTQRAAAGQQAFDFKEYEHPRDSDGQFVNKGEGGHELSGKSSGEGEGGRVSRRKLVGGDAGPPHAGAPAQADEATGRRLPGLFDRPDVRRIRGATGIDSGRDELGAGDATGEAGDVPDGRERPRRRKRRARRADLAAGNWRYHDEDFVKGGPKAKFKQNLDAIKTIRAIEAEGRTTATPEEQETLAKFTGWGQFPQVFKRYGDTGWQNESDALKALLSDSEYGDAKKVADVKDDQSASYQAARKATLNSHFTSPQIVKAHWEMAQRLGFKGGRYLEPSVGSGYYLGMMPAELAGATSVTGVELDATTAKIAKYLYPSATVKHQGFEKYQAPDNFFDLVASNVPFGDYKLHEERYNKHRAPIHDHFFLKSIDKTRPGGLIMHVTSTGTMDKPSRRIREEMAKHADLIAAIRLPGKTHAEAAGTEVVTDLLILRKHTEAGAAPEQTPADVKVPEPGFTGVLTDSLGRVYHFVNGKRVPGNHWTETTTVPDPGGGDPIEVNQYFADRPEQILGTLDRTGTMYRSDSKNVTPPEDFDAALRGAIERLPEDIYTEDAAPAEAFAPEVQPDPDGALEGNLVVRDGAIWQKREGVLVKRDVKGKDVDRITDVLEIRHPLRTIIRQELAGNSSDESRSALNDAYDAFVDKHGPLHERANIKAMADDPDLPLLLSLEQWDPESKTATKADIFTQNTIRPDKKITSADSVPEAVGISLHEHGRLDMDAIAKLVDSDIEDVKDDLRESGVAFDDPERGWIPRAEYLSGNVRKKLEMARTAAENDPAYEINVKALEDSQPEDIDNTEISAKLGAPWVPGADMEEFAAHLLNGEAKDFQAQYVPESGQWSFDFRRGGDRRIASSNAAETWSTPDKSFTTLMDAALNSRTPNVYDHEAEGNRTLNVAATEAAIGKVQDMRDEFSDWLWADEERRERLSRFYNDNFNNIVPMEYDGSHLTFPGMMPSWKMRAVQANFVWQAITRGKGVLAHEVGLGKTATMVATAMELRRLGLAKKPAIIALKSNLEQLAREAQELYPGAKIITTAGQFDAKKRKEAVSRIATGDYDMVFLTHDNINMLPMSKEVQERFIREEVEELELALESAKNTDQSKSSRTVKQLEKRKAKLEATLSQAIEKGKDDAVTFEETGIDFLMVDEAHKYKSLPIYTSMQELAGIPQTRSNRATSMLMRTKWLQEQNGGRGVVFATGTPVSNTMAELYNLQRYVQPEELKERGLNQFDAWAATFGDYETALEPDLKGGYKTKTRFSQFVNVPELMQITRQDLDVRRADSLKNPDGSPAVPRPNKLEHMVLAPETDGITEMMRDIHSRAKSISGRRSVKGEDNPLSLTTSGRQGSVDLRLYDSSMPDDPKSKTNMMVKNVLDRYHDPDKTGQTQLIFSDIGVHPNKTSGFHLYQDIIDKLVAGGIPRSEIADFGALEGKKKIEAAMKLKAGDMRIGLGSTERLGTGNNVQTHLGAMHHLDIPYVPTAIEQRDGRGYRHGNRNKDINIYRYVSEGSLDEMSWGIVSRKSNFIQQAVTDPKGGQRTITEEDTEALTPQQLMAAASGDTRVLDAVNLRASVKQLRSAKARHENDQGKLNTRIKQAKETIQKLDTQAEAVSQDAATVSDHPAFVFAFESGGSSIDRKNAAERLEFAVKAIDEKASKIPYWQRHTIESTHVGEYKGLMLHRVDSAFQLHGPSGETYATGESLASIENVARGLQKRAIRMRTEATKTRSDVESISAQVGKKFRRSDELEKADAALKALEKDMKENKRQSAAEPETETDKNRRRGVIDQYVAMFEQAGLVTNRVQRPQPSLASQFNDAFHKIGTFNVRPTILRCTARTRADHRPVGR